MGTLSTQRELNKQKPWLSQGRRGATGKPLGEFLNPWKFQEREQELEARQAWVRASRGHSIRHEREWAGVHSGSRNGFCWRVEGVATVGLGARSCWPLLPSAPGGGHSRGGCGPWRHPAECVCLELGGGVAGGAWEQLKRDLAPAQAWRGFSHRRSCPWSSRIPLGRICSPYRRDGGCSQSHSRPHSLHLWVWDGRTPRRVQTFHVWEKEAVTQQSGSGLCVAITLTALGPELSSSSGPQGL